MIPEDKNKTGYQEVNMFFLNIILHLSMYNKINDLHLEKCVENSYSID